MRQRLKLDLNILYDDADDYFDDYESEAENTPTF